MRHAKLKIPHIQAPIALPYLYRSFERVRFRIAEEILGLIRGSSKILVDLQNIVIQANQIRLAEDEVEIL